MPRPTHPVHLLPHSAQIRVHRHPYCPLRSSRCTHDPYTHETFIITAAFYASLNTYHQSTLLYHKHLRQPRPIRFASTPRWWRRMGKGRRPRRVPERFWLSLELRYLKAEQTYILSWGSGLTPLRSVICDSIAGAGGLHSGRTEMLLHATWTAS
ncbi:hypothetical protein BD779DRAFT_107894 [Infundibulicybe gibba]|nr:hypothetical protein BD779DRAFT_107894 [Infundibulicybe gibba]